MAHGTRGKWVRVTAVICTALLAGSDVPAAQQAQNPQQAKSPQPAQNPQPASAPEAQVSIPAEQLDSLVAPIALYPDPLLAQVIAASTYPLELVQLQQWLDQNKNLKDKALADAVAKQPWDPSVQALAGTRDIVQRLAGNIQWTED